MIAKIRDNMFTYKYDNYNFIDRYEEQLNSFDILLHHYNKVDKSTLFYALKQLYLFSFNKKEYFEFVNICFNTDFSKFVYLDSNVEVEKWDLYSFVENVRVKRKCVAVDSFVAENREYSVEEINTLVDNKILLPVNKYEEHIGKINQNSVDHDDINYTNINFCQVNEEEDDGLIFVDDQYKDFYINYVFDHLDKRKMYDDLKLVVKQLNGVLLDYLHVVPYKFEIKRASMEELTKVQEVYNRSLKLVNGGFGYES